MQENPGTISGGYFKPSHTIIFLSIVAIGLGLALYTDNRWEDWYIAYRSGKNLATGNGLVFTGGQRVDSFTSPLGTLIPALLNLATFNRSDDLVIWLYRIISLALMGLAGITLLKICNHARLSRLPPF